MPINIDDKINFLKSRGYELVGDLPTCTDYVPLHQGMGAFLFTRRGSYYQYQLRAFYSSDKMPQLDDSNEPILTNPAPEKLNNVMFNPFSKIGAPADPEKNKGFVYTAIEELDNPNASPKYILFVKHDVSKTFHKTMATYHLPPPLIYKECSLANLNREELAKELERVKRFPKAAYVLLRDGLIYVKKINGQLVWEEINFKSGSNPALLKEELRILFLKNQVDKFKDLTENQSISINDEITSISLDLIQQHTLNHKPLIHSAVGGEMYFLTKKTESVEVKGEEPIPEGNSLILVNNKSGGFQKLDLEVKNMLRKLKNLSPKELEAAYVPNLITPELVEPELLARLQGKHLQVNSSPKLPPLRIILNSPPLQGKLQAGQKYQPPKSRTFSPGKRKPDNFFGPKQADNTNRVNRTDSELNTRRSRSFTF